MKCAFLLLSGATLAVSGCTALPPNTAISAQASDRAIAMPTPASGSTSQPVAKGPDTHASATILPGTPPTYGAHPVPSGRQGRGEVLLNFPNVDVQLVAKAVLGETLGLPYTIAPDVHSTITLISGHKIARAAVLPTFEDALRGAGLALVRQTGAGYSILPIEQAKALGPLGGSSRFGFAEEVVPLRYVNADELKRLIDPVLPGVVTSADVSRNVLTIAGTEGQRTSARELVRQFDVDWLRGTSFGLFVPQRTDARLIVPELDKVLNADGSPTRNLVRLIAMDRLNGILAISTQPQYLADVQRWVEILDREGESNARRLFVYRVQNGRAADLARVLANAFGQAGASANGAGALGFAESTRAPGTIGVAAQNATIPSTNAVVLGSNVSTAAGQTPADGLNAAPVNLAPGGEGAAAAGGANIDSDNFHARITADNVNNALIVYANPRDYAVVEDALRRLDIAPLQVMIEAAITEVTLTDALRFGVQGLYNNKNVSAGLTESAASAVPVQAFPGFSALYAAKTVTAALNALEQLTKVNVVSAPKLLVLNNQTASIEVGNQVPILTGSATSTITTNAPVVNSVDYRDTGVLLKVTPRVNSSGLILLDLAQEVSDVVAAGTASTIDSPTISTRRIATSIAVQDGEVIALGGLIRDNRMDTKTGLPFLSRIPVLGAALFGNINNNDTRTELIVLLRPKVVRTVEDGRAVTEELREKLLALKDLLPPGRIP